MEEAVSAPTDSRLADMVYAATGARLARFSSNTEPTCAKWSHCERIGRRGWIRPMLCRKLSSPSPVAGFPWRRPMSFRLWDRKIAQERLINAPPAPSAARRMRREALLPDASSLLLARRLLATGPTPSQTPSGEVAAIREAVTSVRRGSRDSESAISKSCQMRKRR